MTDDDIAAIARSDNRAWTKFYVIYAPIMRTYVAHRGSPGPGNYCYVRLDYARCSIIFSAVGTHDKSRKAVAHEVVRSVKGFLKAGKACEKHLADQLLVPLNVFVGGHDELEQVGAYWEDLVWHPSWNLEVQKETLHYKMSQEVIAEFGLHE